MLTVIGSLGFVLSSSVVYFLLLSRIRLSHCQNRLIMNIAVGDTLLSVIGVFRGLGIINSRFVGAPNNTTTPYCAVYTFFLNSVGYSCMVTLLPLTIDRAVAILLPLRHSSIITHRTCAYMFAVNWLLIFGLLVFYIVTYAMEAIDVTYQSRYHRCLISGGSFGELYE